MTRASGHPRRPAAAQPRIDDYGAPFHAAATKGKLVVQRCASCGRLRWTPRPMCPHCHSLSADWPEVAPIGTVWSFCIPHPPLPPEFAERVPFAVALVALAGHPEIRMIGDLIDVPPATVKIGAAVRAVFEVPGDDVGLVHWTPR
jgi:uncharacterized protein